MGRHAGYVFRMSLALEVHGITKRYVAGAGSCVATATALQSIDLIVSAGESVAIIGGPSSGKSTLLLCAAGLLVPDDGIVRWWGKDSRRDAALRSTYYFADARGPGRTRAPLTVEPHLHLIDAADSLAPAALVVLRRWIDRRCARGDASVIACRDAAVARAVAQRMVTLDRGLAYATMNPVRAARVAEPAAAVVRGGGAL